MELIAIARDGGPGESVPHLPPPALEALASTAKLYRDAGFEPPWVSYVAVEDESCVGICAFKSAPHNNRVEIAYFTFPGHEGKGIATRMAKSLIEIALSVAPRLLVTAQTLAGENASTAVLRKLGFQMARELDDPEDGKLWDWHLGA